MNHWHWFDLTVWSLIWILDDSNLALTGLELRWPVAELTADECDAADPLDFVNVDQDLARSDFWLLTRTQSSNFLKYYLNLFSNELLTSD